MRAADRAYEGDEFRWWHSSEPNAELREAISDRWFRPPGRALDLGCGLGTELSAMTRAGFVSVGVDLSRTALHGAVARGEPSSVVQADVRRLPFGSGQFDVALDRGCFHYLGLAQGVVYERELRRVLRPSGRFLLRACCNSEGRPNHISESYVRRVFHDWTFERLERRSIRSDTRTMPAWVAWLVAPVPGTGIPNRHTSLGERP
jgi:SAM-dependent methyltransferase